MPVHLGETLYFKAGSLELLARQAVEGFITGLHKSPYHGFSVEFSEHRAYNSGESVRFIDWKLFGRTEKLYIKRFEEETNLQCQIVVDVSSSMYYPVMEQVDINNLNKITFSAVAAASIMQMQQKQRDATGLSLFSSSIETNIKARSVSQHYKMLVATLEKLLYPFHKGEDKPTAIAESLHTIAETIHKRSMVIIFSDLMDAAGRAADLYSALQHLAHNKHEVILFHVNDGSHEHRLEFSNRMHRFIDMETGEEIKLNPMQMQETYRNSMNQFLKELKLKCNQYHIDYVDADINAGYRQILLPWLLKRQAMS